MLDPRQQPSCLTVQAKAKLDLASHVQSPAVVRDIPARRNVAAISRRLTVLIVRTGMKGQVKFSQFTAPPGCWSPVRHLSITSVRQRPIHMLMHLRSATRYMPRLLIVVVVVAVKNTLQYLDGLTPQSGGDIHCTRGD